jgi:predicted SprT family Zn-dependent metalloprotease
MKTMHEELVSDVCALFDLAIRPTIDFNARRSNACYYSSRSHIKISRRYDPAEVKQALVHELAHHVDYSLNHNRRNRRSHDEVYFFILIDVIQLCYDDPSEYKWYREYPTLYKWACRKGLAESGLNWQGVKQ